VAVSEWVRVADETDIAPGQGLRVEVDDEPVAIWNVEGTLYATADTCTHEEASLSEGDLWREVVECPLHGAQFDVRTGEVLSLPAVFPVATYPVKVEDGGVFVGWKTKE
jgi:3-phenylpropionate/trans-cinnamate dioxygenase ferredoxin subunit